jgi:hypothetical protein
MFIKNTEILVDVACVAYHSADAAMTILNSKNGEMNMKVYNFMEDSLISKEHLIHQ